MVSAKQRAAARRNIKKAQAALRGDIRRGSRKNYKVTTSRSTMRRKTTRRYHRTKKLLSGEKGGLITGAAIYLVYKTYLEPVLMNSVPMLGQIGVPAVETVGGYVAMDAKRAPEWIKGFGKVSFVFGLVGLGSNILPQSNAGGSGMTFY